METAHELGHVLGLRHCLDWQCVMASTHDVERLDLKGEEYCPPAWPRPPCKALLRAPRATFSKRYSRHAPVVFLLRFKFRLALIFTVRYRLLTVLKELGIAFAGIPHQS